MKTKLFSVLALLPALVFAQYSNGALSTGATSKSGTAAPAGYTWSELQNDTGNTTESNTNLGYSAMRSSTTASYFLADDFVVPAGETWQISTVEVFSYQTNYTGTTSPFNTIRINIYNGDPSTTGTSVFGDDTTNRFAGSVDAMMYRIGNTAVPTAGVTNTARKLWKTTGNVNASMPAGTYWLKYQLENITLASGGFSPPVTIVGSRTQPGFNAKQFDEVGVVWTDLLDTGNPAAAPDVAMDMAFIINYQVLGTGEILQYDNRVVLFPNPVKDSFSIQLPKESQSKKTVVEIFDMSGKLVKKMPFAESFNAADLQSGTYLVKINDGTNTKVTRFVKK